MDLVSVKFDGEGFGSHNFLNPDQGFLILI